MKRKILYIFIVHAIKSKWKKHLVAFSVCEFLGTISQLNKTKRKTKLNSFFFNKLYLCLNLKIPFAHYVTNLIGGSELLNSIWQHPGNVTVNSIRITV